MDTQVQEDVGRRVQTEGETVPVEPQPTPPEVQAEPVNRVEKATHVDRYRISKKLVVTKDIHKGFTLVYNLRRGSIRRCSTTFWRALKFENRWGGYVAWRSELKQLVQEGFLVPLGMDEQKETLKEYQEILERGRHHQLYWSIWPTTNCNLACDYCGQEHTNQKLSREECDLAVQLIERRLKAHGFKRLHVGWFGGEPLLGFDVMQYLTPHLFKVAKDLEIPFDARVVSNGTLLTKEISTALVNHMGVTWIDVTLDGPREVHDKRRCTVAGGPTYDRIIQNITDFFEVRAERRTARLTLRCNVDVRNAGSAKQLIDHLASLGLQKEVGYINFANVFPWGTPRGQRYMFKSRRKYAKMNLEICEYARSKEFRCSFLPMGHGGTCQVSGNDSTVNVIPGGRLYVCGEIPLVPKYRKQDHYRWWDKGTLEHLREQKEEDITFSSSWATELAQGKWRCTRCRWFGMCLGECPKQHRDRTARCPQTIYNFTDRMRAYSRLNLPVPEKSAKERPPKRTARKLLKRLRAAGARHG